MLLTRKPFALTAFAACMGMLLYFDFFQDLTMDDLDEWWDEDEDEPPRTGDNIPTPKPRVKGREDYGSRISSKNDVRNSNRDRSKSREKPAVNGREDSDSRISSKTDVRDGKSSRDGRKSTSSARPTPNPCSHYTGGRLEPCKRRIGKKLQATGAKQLHLAIVACWGRVVEAMVLLKSVVALTTESHMVFYIFTELNQLSYFEKELNAWPTAALERVEYRLYVATYPDAVKTWKDKFGPCASQRLLFPLLLRDVDAVVYVDADAVLLSPLDKLWAELSRFNSTQMVALAAEHEDAATSWYHHHSKIPFFRPYGLNSGVVLMNLTRLRQVNFTSAILQYEKEYGKSLSWFDQDLLNIFCHFHPDRYYKLSCSANYRGDHCTQKHRAPNSICKAAEHEGVYVLHGSKRAFHKLFPFIHVLNSFREFKLESNITTLLRTMENKLKKTSNQPCGYMSNAFLKHIRELAEKEQSSP